MRASTLAACLPFFFIAACSDDAAGTADASPDTTADTSADTTADSSADTALDTTTPDTAPDTTEPETQPDTTEPDTADTADTAETDTSACEYFEEPEALKCGQAYVQILRWVAPGCEPYWTRGEDRYDTFEALAAAEQCDPSCHYRLSTGVSFLRCDTQTRWGYETFETEDAGCVTPLYRTDDGIFTDLCLWALYACYCEEP